MINYLDILKAFGLVILAFVLARMKSIPVEKEIAYGSIRSFIQLIAVGYALEFIFNSDSLWLVAAAILVMLTVGSYTAGGRAMYMRNGFRVAFIAMTCGSLVSLGALPLMHIFEWKAEALIPLGGMIVSNSMNAASVTMDRIGSDLKEHRLEIETALSLGRNWRESSRRFYQMAVRAGMLSILNFMKTVGIVALPGAMTGMILAGASPLQAVLLQIIVAYMLLSSVTITAILSGELSIRRFFNRSEQFVMDINST
jgi:putative ABC transport system permease protein